MAFVKIISLEQITVGKKVKKKSTDEIAIIGPKIDDGRHVMQSPNRDTIKQDGIAWVADPRAIMELYEIEE